MGTLSSTVDSRLLAGPERPGIRSGTPINRSKPLWTVTFEQSGFWTEVRSVITAWFAGT